MDDSALYVTCNLTIESIVILDQRFFFLVLTDDTGKILATKRFGIFGTLRSCEWFVDILMIGSTTENLAGILKVQYLKVRKNNKNHNFVLIQIKFRNIYLLIEQEEINRFLKLKKMSSYISMCKNSSSKFSLKYYIPKNFKCVHCSCTNDSTICQTSR